MSSGTWRPVIWQGHLQNYITEVPNMNNHRQDSFKPYHKSNCMFPYYVFRDMAPCNLAGTLTEHKYLIWITTDKTALNLTTSPTACARIMYSGTWHPVIWQGHLQNITEVPNMNNHRQDSFKPYHRSNCMCPYYVFRDMAPCNLAGTLTEHHRST